MKVKTAELKGVALNYAYCHACHVSEAVVVLIQNGNEGAADIMKRAEIKVAAGDEVEIPNNLCEMSA